MYTFLSLHFNQIFNRKNWSLKPTIQLKLDEIIRATKGAHNEMIDIEKLTDEDLARIQKKYGLLADKTKEDLKKGKLDTNTQDINLSPVIKTT